MRIYVHMYIIANADPSAENRQAQVDWSVYRTGCLDNAVYLRIYMYSFHRLSS